MTDHEPIDPVERRNNEDERMVLELAQLDDQLDGYQQRLEQIEHNDPVGFIWFGDNDDWLNKRLNAPGGR